MTLFPVSNGSAARLAYHKVENRTLIVLIVAAAVFIVLAGVLLVRGHGDSINPLVMLATTGACCAITALCLLSKWPANTFVQFFCPACGKYLPVTDPWRCGTCDREIRGGPSFLACCPTCGIAPTAYACYHCGAVISLTDNVPITHIAVRLPTPGIIIAPIRSVWVNEEQFRQLEKSRLSDEIELAKLNNALADLKSPPKLPDPRQSKIEEILRIPREARDMREALRAFRKEEEAKIRTQGLTDEELARELEQLEKDIDLAFSRIQRMY